MLAFVIIPCCYCHAGCNRPSFNAKHLKVVKTFYYQVNSNPDSIGYSVFSETGEISSISSLKVVNKYVYLTDAVHGNVKRVDITTGNLIVSEKLDRDSCWLSSMAYFNNLLFVFTFRGNVYLLDKSLVKKGSLFLKDYFGNDIEVYSENKDSLVIYGHSSMDIFQDNNHKDFLRRMIIDKNNHYSFDTIALTSEESFFRLKKETGKEEIEDSQLIYKTNKGEYEIPDSIEIRKEYDCKRIDYTDNYLVNFEVDSKCLKLVVYEYE